MRNIVLGVALIWSILIIILCLVESKELATAARFDIPYRDKIAHFGFYFTFSFLWLMYFLKSKKGKSRVASTLLIFTIAVLFGGCLEFAQFYFTSSRSAEWADFFANCLGSLTGLLLCLAITKNKQ